MESPEGGFSLYVHVPFCVDKCLYCDFYSVACRSVAADVPARVVEQTIEQARFLVEALSWEEPPRTIFVGGGTPSVLGRPALGKLLSAFAGRPCEEWTVEANPESLDEAFLDICLAQGVTRISAGVQSTSDDHLRLLRRECTAAEIERAAVLLQRRWRGDLNLDFIAGIPGQEPGQVRADLSILDRLPASHVSLYSLTYEPGTPLASLVQRGRIRPNSEEQDEELWFAGRDELQRRGYRQYEISNFSMPGRECRHNLRYWRIEPYLGVGPGAVSTLPGRGLQRTLGLHQDRRAEAHGSIVRLANPKDIGSFLGGREKLWGAQIEVVEPEDFLLETLMMGLRLEEGIPTAVFQRRFGRPFGDLFPGTWEHWQERGLAQEPGTRLALTETGRLFLDGLLAEASRAREKAAPRQMPQVVWP